jgi:hypothetical protein
MTPGAVASVAAGARVLDITWTQHSEGADRRQHTRFSAVQGVLPTTECNSLPLVTAWQAQAVFERPFTWRGRAFFDSGKRCSFVRAMLVETARHRSSRTRTSDTDTITVCRSVAGGHT